MSETTTVIYRGPSEEPMVVVHGDVEFEFVKGEPVDLPAELVHGRARDDDADDPGVEGLLAQVEYRDGEVFPVWELVSVAKAARARAKREKSVAAES